MGTYDKVLSLIDIFFCEGLKLFINVDDKLTFESQWKIGCTKFWFRSELWNSKNSLDENTKQITILVRNFSNCAKIHKYRSAIM